MLAKLTTQVTKLSPHDYLQLARLLHVQHNIHTQNKQHVLTPAAIIPILTPSAIDMFLNFRSILSTLYFFIRIWAINRGDNCATLCEIVLCTRELFRFRSNVKTNIAQCLSYQGRMRLLDAVPTPPSAFPTTYAIFITTKAEPTESL